MPRIHFPHPLTLLVAGIFLAALLTWILPSGRFERAEDPDTGREVVVAGTYQRVAEPPVGPLGALVAIPQGMIEAADVIFLVFLVGGAFAVVERTGALRVAVAGLVRRLRGRDLLVIPIASVAFATGGALQNMAEEIIALIPVLLLLVRSLGFTPLVAVAVSLGAAAVGSAFSPINPFQVGIAQRVADVPLLSGAGYRMIFLLIALAIWIGWTMLYARRNRTEPEHFEPQSDDVSTGRTSVILLLVLLAFATFVYGVSRLGWGFNELSGVFFAMGVLAGLVGRLGAEGTARAFVDGFRDMAFAGLLIGFARAIYVVLNDGLVIDTIVQGLFTPLAGLPRAASVAGMWGVHTIIHVPVPSVSSQAVLTLPILAPLSDLLGIARQVTILAYQYGAGLCELLTPTNGALMAVLAAAGLRYGEWMRFVVPLWLVLSLLGIGAALLALATGLT